MIDVKSARYLSEYKVWIEFNNGESGVADLESDLWGPMFEPLRDPGQFRTFRVSDVMHTLVWDNGADFAPEHLYEKVSNSLLHPTERLS